MAVVYYYREYDRVETRRDIYALTITAEEQALIDSGQHELYSDIEEWARDQDLPGVYDSKSHNVDFQDLGADGVEKVVA
jgi:hypothetical protein